MRASEAYVLDVALPADRVKPFRRPSALLRGLLGRGAGVSSESRILIADAITGRVLGSVPVIAGDDLRVPLAIETDLHSLSAGEFAHKYLERS